MVDRSRLGRGLDFFLSGSRNNPPPPAQPVAGVKAEVEAGAGAQDGIQQVSLDLLDPNPNQPRRQIAEKELQELANSIKTNGLLQPILVRKAGERFEVIAGERRWRAAALAGMTQVPVVVRNVDHKESAVFALVENVQREDLNAIDKAVAFRSLMQLLGDTQEEVARKVGFERSTVANFLRLLDLPDEIQAHVSRGTLSMGHARSLLALSDASLMVALATQCIKEAWSVRRLEAEVKAALERSKGGAPASAKATASRPVWLSELEESLVEALGSPVSIRYGRKRSQITIECGSREDFERIFQRLKNA